MEEESSEGLEGSVGAEGPEDAEGSDADAWDSEGSEGAGWFADPDVEGQERYFDGSEWTSETRSADADAPLHHLPDHAGELQRALAAATDDIDDVEDRLGTLFDRAQQVGERDGRARKQAAAGSGGRAGEGRTLSDAVEHADGDDDDSVWADADAEAEAGDHVVAGADDDALADLDEALASEEPEKVKRSFFRRRS
ncbi:MAG TPA: DUF2510 domain-containing protein [Acidimicrobiales bacterium]|jgi:hypothetical protein|nr:DUF2510 domain-containing protein [Acidimicrobiales bacterium]